MAFVWFAHHHTQIYILVSVARPSNPFLQSASEGQMLLHYDSPFVHRCGAMVMMEVISRALNFHYAVSGHTLAPI